VAAWVFAAGGWGAGTGTAVATAFGVLTAVSTLPGLVVLVAGWLRPRIAEDDALSTQPVLGPVPLEEPA
jgi:hypothetical protein